MNTQRKISKATGTRKTSKYAALLIALIPAILTIAYLLIYAAIDHRNTNEILNYADVVQPDYIA